MRPKHEGAERIEFWGARYSCECGFADIERAFKFCPGCGARLDWREGGIKVETKSLPAPISKELKEVLPVLTKKKSHHKGKY